MFEEEAKHATASIFQQVLHQLTCLGLSLTTGQIDKVELASTDVLLPSFVVAAHLHEDGEDGVAAAGVSVHQSGAHRPVLPTPFHDVVAVHDVVNRMHRQTLKEQKERAQDKALSLLSTPLQGRYSSS